MAVLLIADVLNGELSIDQTSKTLTGAKMIGPVSILCASKDTDDAATELAKLDGVKEVLVADNDLFKRGLSEPLSLLIKKLSQNFTHIIAASNSQGKNILPRVAALLDVMIISDVTKIISDDTFERPIYAGNAIETVKSSDVKKVLSIRTTSFESSSTSEPCEIKKIETFDSVTLSEWIKDDVQTSDRPELTSAKIVVSGGRGIGSENDFLLIEKLADKLNAAVGASRAAVDSGYAPNDWQVGQTGKVVAPELYVAVGISGAIQHLAGMKDSKVIVAINKDEEAPIFQVADYGLVGDLFQVLPELEEKL